MVTIDFANIVLNIKTEAGKTTVFDPIRKKWVFLTPEEQVRQYLLQYLITQINYPAGMIAVEKSIVVGTLIKRYDIVIYNRQHQPWMLIECKAPQVPITATTLNQLLNYQSVIQSSFWLLTNGHQTYCANAKDTENITWLSSLPGYNF